MAYTCGAGEKFATGDGNFVRNGNVLYKRYEPWLRCISRLYGIIYGGYGMDNGDTQQHVWYKLDHNKGHKLTPLLLLMIPFSIYPESKVHGANTGPNWDLSAPEGPHVGPWNLLSGYLTICCKQWLTPFVWVMLSIFCLRVMFTFIIYMLYMMSNSSLIYNYIPDIAIPYHYITMQVCKALHEDTP